MSSYEFDDAFCCHSSSDALCEYCGTVEFSHESPCFDEYMEKSATDPKYRFNSMDDSIGWGWIDGKQYVYQCGCGKVDRIEEWVWRNREQIAAYLVARAKKEATEANCNLESMLVLEPKGT